MGYRSDIVAVFYTTNNSDNNRAKLKLFVEENFPKCWREEKEGQEGQEGQEENLTLLDQPHRVLYEFKVSSVKWYDSYSEVIAFEQFWDRFREMCEDEAEGDEPPLWAAEFIRIGENTDDIEERCVGDNEWLIQISRVININY
jgi:hypothetical protein